MEAAFDSFKLANDGKLSFPERSDVLLAIKKLRIIPGLKPPNPCCKSPFERGFKIVRVSSYSTKNCFKRYKKELK
jgi:hypothetical protein